jgi:enterochelin esterase-like enzyme
VRCAGLWSSYSHIPIGVSIDADSTVFSVGRQLPGNWRLSLAVIPLIIRSMISIKRLTLLFVFLTVSMLLACEPLAPEQAPQYVVVTGETPVTTAQPSSVAAAISTDEPPGQLVGDAGNAAVVSLPSGVVNTPELSATPLPPPTALSTVTPFVCAQARGQMIRSSVYSAVAGAEVDFRVYLPPCFYETFQRYPYVVLLHGTGFDDSMWDDLGAPTILDQGIADGTLPPMALVMPDGGVMSELNDQPDGASYEAMILDELIPQVESDFCLWGGRSGRAIGGISRGGFWAFSIVLRHPELFSAVGGHSPHFEPDNALPESNPLDLASRVNLDKYPLRIYMDNAANDYVGTYAIQMSDILRSRGIRHDYLVNPTGDHDMDYWGEHVAEYLSFYGQTWPLDAMALPSCMDPSPD